MNIIEDYNIDLLIMDNDGKGKFSFLKEYCDVLYQPFDTQKCIKKNVD
jgi:predicted Fe-Mo cluster-binding NifX family protein